MTIHILTAYAWGLLPVGLTCIASSVFWWAVSTFKPAWDAGRRAADKAVDEATEEAWEQANQL